MWAFVIALSLLMWLWIAAGLHLVRALEKKGVYHVRMAYMAVIGGIGGILLLSLPWMVLPGSSLSLGWTRNLLENTQRLSLLLVFLAGVAGLVRARLVLLPAVTCSSTKQSYVPPTRRKLPPKKRRP